MYREKVKSILYHIKLRRQELGYTQKYMAHKLCIHQNMYSKIEKNQVKFTADVFLLICEVLEMDACKLLKLV